MKNYILFEENSIYYEIGYSNDNCILLVIQNEKYFYTDTRYQQEAKEKTKNVEIIITDNLIQKVKEKIKKEKIKKIIIDPNQIKLTVYEQLCTNNETHYIQASDFSRKNRMIKTDYEISLLQKAVDLGTKAFKNIEQIIKNGGLNGLNEYEINFKILEQITHKGQYDVSFEPITAVNQNAALPHAKKTNKIFTKNDLLLIDSGLKYERYCSDKTRTFINEENKKIKEIKQIVKDAHDKAIEGIKVGMKCSEIDFLARDYINKQGYGQYFIHSTGHGVGLDIHEYPFISKNSDVIVEENMVFTIEPGIYLPNEFGVRVEDMVVIKNGIAKVM